MRKLVLVITLAVAVFCQAQNKPSTAQLQLRKQCSAAVPMLEQALKKSPPEIDQDTTSHWVSECAKVWRTPTEIRRLTALAWQQGASFGRETQQALDAANLAEEKRGSKANLQAFDEVARQHARLIVDYNKLVDQYNGLRNEFNDYIKRAQIVLGMQQLQLSDAQWQALHPAKPPEYHCDAIAGLATGDMVCKPKP